MLKGSEVGIAPENKLTAALSAHFGRSRAKLRRMIQRLASTGYVSYVQ